MNDEPACYAKFFEQRLLHNLQYWQMILDQGDISTIQTKYSQLLSCIQFTLQHRSCWSAGIKLIYGFEPYMTGATFIISWEGILEKALHLAQQRAEQDTERQLRFLLARLITRQGRFREVVYHYRWVLQTAPNSTDTELTAWSYSNLGYFYAERKFVWRATILLCRAMKLFTTLGHAQGISQTNNHLGILYFKQGEWEQAKQYLHQAYQQWVALDDCHQQVKLLINLSALYLNLNLPKQAKQYCHQALNQSLPIHQTRLYGTVYQNLGLAGQLAEQFDQAEQYLWQAEQIFQAHHDYVRQAHVWKNLGTLYLEQRRWAEAETLLNQALLFWSQSGDIARQLETSHKLAEVVRLGQQSSE